MANISSNVTGKTVDKNKIASTKSGGVLVAGDKVGIFTYIPSREISYTPAETVVSVNGPRKNLSYSRSVDTIDNSHQDIVKRTVYDFGIDSIIVRYTSPKKTSGFLSKPIDIGPCSYITLSVKAAGNLTGRMEFSIIDGSTEISIMPEEMEKYIMHEKLFHGLQTRFSIDTDKAYTIYKDGTVTTLSYEQVLSMPLDDGEYTISYYSLSEYKYVPSNEQIRLKLVVRCSNKKPVPIKAMTIKRYGGEMPWRISD